MGFKKVLKKIGKVAAIAAPIVAAPFTGGASLALIGAGAGAAHGALSGKGAKGILGSAALGAVPGVGKLAAAGKLGGTAAKVASTVGKAGGAAGKLGKVSKIAGAAQKIGGAALEGEGGGDRQQARAMRAQPQMASRPVSSVRARMAARRMSSRSFSGGRR